MSASNINRVKLNGYRWVREYKSGTSQVQDRVQVEVRDRCEIDKEIKDAINKNEVAQLGLSPL